jgi:hypothetical protein
VKARTRLARVAAALAIAGAAVGCASGGGATAAPPQPPVVPGEATAGPDLTGVQLPSVVMPLIKGGISRPNPHLTPGSVVTTNTNDVCGLPDHGDPHPISPQLSAQVYSEYGYTTTSEQHKHLQNYLVPLDLGGGTGFYEVVETDHVMRDLVCRRALPLTVAQHDLETDWYAAWLRYVVLADDA